LVASRSSNLSRSDPTSRSKLLSDWLYILTAYQNDAALHPIVLVTQISKDEHGRGGVIELNG
jgi:hypothetical protein